MKKVFYSLVLFFSPLTAFSSSNTFVVKSVTHLEDPEACVYSQKCVNFNIELKNGQKSNFDQKYGSPSKIQITFENGPNNKWGTPEWFPSYVVLSEATYILGEGGEQTVNGKFYRDFKNIMTKLSNPKCIATVEISDGRFDSQNFKNGEDGILTKTALFPYSPGEIIRSQVSCK